MSRKMKRHTKNSKGPFRWPRLNRLWWKNGRPQTMIDWVKNYDARNPDCPMDVTVLRRRETEPMETIEMFVKASLFHTCPLGDKCNCPGAVAVRKRLVAMGVPVDPADDSIEVWPTVIKVRMLDGSVWKWMPSFDSVRGVIDCADEKEEKTDSRNPRFVMEPIYDANTVHGQKRNNAVTEMIDALKLRRVSVVKSGKRGRTKDSKPMSLREGFVYFHKKFSNLRPVHLGPSSVHATASRKSA